jgi:REP element-mobilizing transposase RayT
MSEDEIKKTDEAPDINRPHSSGLRKGRVSEVYGLYFVTKCLKISFVFSDIQKEHVVEAFLYASQKTTWLLHAFVVMPNHWHALLSLGETKTLSHTIETVNRRISFPTRQGGLSCIPWQPGYFDHKVRPEESIMDIVDYIEMNPVRKGICELSEEWEWSSKNPKYASALHREFLGHERWARRDSSRIL